MAGMGVCSECGGVLNHPAAKTDTPACRARRARRLKRQKREAGRAGTNPPHLAHLAQMDDKLVHEIAKEELRPVIREAITEDVLRAAGELVALTPVMVAAISEDLHGTDKFLRQKAYSLLARYTLGNTSIAPVQEHRDQPMQVVFNMPRPGDDPTAPAAAPAAAVELKQCMECAADKPVDQFVGTSERCLTCHEDLKARVLAEFDS